MVPDASDRRRPAAEEAAQVRDRRTTRRGLLAGAVVWAGVGGLLGVGLAPAGGDASAVGMLLGLAAGLVVTSAWLLLAAGLDLLADQPIGRGRGVVTLAVLIAAMVVPLLVAAAGG